jgi:hypothetical protein
MAYNYRDMSRRRNKKGDTPKRPQLNAPPSPPAPAQPTVLSPVAFDKDSGTNVPPHLSDDFKGIIERAADRVRNDLTSTGKIAPTVFFVYTNGTMKVLSFSFKAHLQEEELIRRIREKALTENASAVLVLTKAEHKPRGEAVLSGVTRGMSASARLNYSFDEKTKAVTLWKMSWLEKPVQNSLLDGIYDKAG